MMDDNTKAWDRKAVLRPPEGSFTSYESAHEHVAAFENLLAEHGIKVRCGSQLETACLITLELREQKRDPSRRVGTAIFRNHLREVVGLLQLVQLMLRLRNHPDFYVLLPHLRLLNEGSPTQNTIAEPNDQASNKLFELLVALAAMSDGRHVQLDPPTCSDGTNPDVLATMLDGRKWGFACKVVHGDAPMTLFERIEDGIDQIERSEAETGIVVVSFKNKLPHDEVFPLMGNDPETGDAIIGAHLNVGVVACRLAESVEERTTAMADEVTQPKVVEAFDGKKALPGIIVVVQAAAGVISPRGPSPSLIGFLHLITFEDPTVESRFTEEVMGVIDSLNQALQLR